MGGCESAQFMKDVYNAETAIIAQKVGELGYTSQNSHTFMAILDRLKMMDSWEEFNGELTKNSENLKNFAVVPGTSDYYQYVTGEKK